MEAERKRIKFLQARLAKLNQEYYEEDSPSVSDYDYDLLLKELGELEAKHPDLKTGDSPTVKVGGQASSYLPAVRHRQPMLSLQDAFNEAEVEAFCENILAKYPQASFVVEEKIDGLSVSLLYQDQEFKQALSRGDGRNFGEDISANVLQLQNLPQTIASEISDLELRGEIYLAKARFEQINRERKKAGLSLFANPRNCAAGTIRGLDSSVVKARGLELIIFNIQHSSQEVKTQVEGLKLVSSLGFQASPNFYQAKTSAEVLAAIQAINQKREDLPYGIDGAVIKVNEIAIRELLGASSKTPRWALAFKYPPEQAVTRVKDIIVQVGRTGKITPVADLEPVLVDGSTVSRAVLHNQAIIDSLDLRIGDYVLIHKSGDIIPAVVKVLIERRKPSLKPYLLPELCPSCQSQLAYKQAADLYCQNPSCPDQLERSLTYFASKQAMDIRGLASSTVKALIKDSYLKDISDIYRLWEKREEIIDKGIIGRSKRVDNLLAAIEASKANELSLVITALGIDNIGLVTARSLAQHFTSLKELSLASQADLEAIPEIGQISAGSIADYFSLEKNQELIQELASLGLSSKASPQVQGDLTGLRFGITGSFDSFTRTELKKILEKRGARVSSSISKNLNYLLAGSKAGQKLEKAKSIGIEILDEPALIDFLAN